jgi:translation initiation factor 5A
MRNSNNRIINNKDIINLDMSDEEFEVADSGATGTFPIQAGGLRKGGYVMIKERPCKITEITSSKPGKHGHAKCNITAIDIFNNKKYEDCCPSSHNMNVPNVTRTEYQLLDILEDGYLSLLDENN